MSVTLQCPTHPRYKAMHRPKSDCPACQLLWELAEGSDPCIVGKGTQDLHDAFRAVRRA